MTEKIIRGKISLFKRMTALKVVIFGCFFSFRMNYKRKIFKCVKLIFVLSWVSPNFNALRLCFYSSHWHLITCKSVYKSALPNKNRAADVLHGERNQDELWRSYGTSGCLLHGHMPTALLILEGA